MKYTITYDEDSKGWTSFHSFIPDWMKRLNNNLFSVKDGQLYIHNDNSNSVRNNFYGEQFNTELTYLVNQYPSDIKFAKTLKLEANKPMSAEIKSYINDETESITLTTLDSSEFLDKEGLQYAYLRQNEISSDLSAQNVYGLGRVSTVNTTEVTLTTPVPLGSISSGDSILNEQQELVGIVEDYYDDKIIFTYVPILTSGTFILGLKDSRIEGSQIRGYNFEVKLTDSTTSRTEIYAANMSVAKSFP